MGRMVKCCVSGNKIDSNNSYKLEQNGSKTKKLILII